MENRCNLLQPLSDGPIPENFYNTAVSARWAAVMKGCIPKEDSRIENTLFLLPRRKCFFFCGPAGTGKKRMATALAGTLQGSYQCFAVRGRRLRGAGTEKLEECVDTVTALAREQDTFLLLDRPGRYESGRQLLDLLMEELEECGNGLSLVLVVCETERGLFRPEWQDMMMYLPFDLPNREERREFFEETFQQERQLYDKKVKLYNKFPREKALTFDRMADQTEGFSYNQLRQLVDSIKLSLVSEGERYGETAKELVEAIRYGELVCSVEAFEHMAELVTLTREPSQPPKTTAISEPQDYAELLAGLLQNAGQLPRAMNGGAKPGDTQEKARKDANGNREYFTREDLDYFRRN